MRKLLIGLALLVGFGLAAFQLGRSMPVRAGADEPGVPPASASASAVIGEEGRATPAATSTAASRPADSSTPSAGSGDQKPLAGSPFEASLLTDGALNAHAMKLLEAKDFDRVLDQLDAPNAGRANAIAGRYRGQIEATLQSFGNAMRLDRLACGVNVCMGSVRAAGDRSFDAWYEGIQTASVAPIGALSEFPVRLPGGGIEHRLLFTTDPRSAAVIVAPMPRKR